VEAEVTVLGRVFDMAEDPRGLAADDHIPSRVLARHLLGFRPSHRRGPLGKTPILRTDPHCPIAMHAVVCMQIERREFTLEGLATDGQRSEPIRSCNRFGRFLFYDSI
jgi:hypothetical protein